MYTKTPQHIYLRSGSEVYYMNLKDPATGKVIRKSTKATDPVVAMTIYEREQRKLNGLTSSATLADILALYADINSNPRKKQAEINGTSYGYTYADNVARRARQLNELLEKHSPKMLKMEMADISILQIKAIKEIIVKEFGKRPKAEQLFDTLKTFFSQAHEDGIIFNSPCAGLSAIKVKHKSRPAMPIELLRLILSERNYLDNTFWNIVAIAITTGMRRGEILALNKDQLLDNGKALLIDRGVKDRFGTIGTTKTEDSRIIPLSNVAQEILKNMTPDKNGRYFANVSISGFSTLFERKIKKPLRMKYPQFIESWNEMTCHAFRHSLYSHLRCNGANQLLAEEYLSWEHQNLDAMPANYLHIYAYNLQPIAEMIDAMFSEKEQKSQFAIG